MRCSTALAKRLLQAERPVIIVGDEIVKSDALQAAAKFAETLGAPVYQQSVAYGAHFLSEHACFVGGLSRDQKQVRGVLSKFDLLIALGSDPVRMSVWSEVEPLPDGMPVVHIGLHRLGHGQELPRRDGRARRPARDAAGPGAGAGKQGGERLAAKAKAALAELPKGNWTAKRAETRGSASRAAPRPTPIDPDWLTLQIANALPKDAVVVNEGLTSSRHLTDLIPYRDRYGFHALASGGIGWGLPAAVGIALAQAPRPVCCYSGDGSAMYSIQSLWTAAHHKLPITYVIANNGGYRIIKQRLLSFHGNDHFIGMDFAEPKDRLHRAGQVAGHAGRAHHRARRGRPRLAARLLHPRPQAAGRRGRRQGVRAQNHTLARRAWRA